MYIITVLNEETLKEANWIIFIVENLKGKMCNLKKERMFNHSAVFYEQNKELLIRIW